jgi:hypothetical protein
LDTLIFAIGNGALPWMLATTAVRDRIRLRSGRYSIHRPR